MSNYCDLTDLFIDQCGCGHHRPKAPPPDAEADFFSIVARFPARFDSDCDYCGRRMHEGDPIARTDTGDYICERCSD